ncbi:MAG: hypothetical protein ACXABY_06200 [Candidatus Thorarchaeota archaeon]|jgi:hypothetical protein
MVEKNKKFENKDKQKADREKKIKRAESKDRSRIRENLKDIATGKLSPEEFDDQNGQT